MFFTKPFGYYYKHFPSTSYVNTPLQNGAFTNDISFNWTSGGTLGWYHSASTYSAFLNTIRVSHSFFNFPKDASYVDSFRSFNTTGSAVSSGGVPTGSYRALPWGSAASDFLWNIQTAYWSFNEATFGTGTTSDGYWYAAFTSESFLEKYYPAASGSLGSKRYNITSSWIAYDRKMYPRADGNRNFSLFRSPSPPPANPYEDYIVVGTPETPNTTPPTFNSNVYTTMSYQLGRASGSAGSGTYMESSSIDNQPFYRAGGAAISRTNVSASLVLTSVSASATSGNDLAVFRRGLKSRRLFFPTPVSASGTTRSQDYWFKTFTGFGANQVFTENGGIYQVDFTLKRDLANDIYPDTGSFLSVFISDCQTEAPVPANRAAGQSGWYPPESNIVTIFNGTATTPVMSFYDIQTGYLHEKFSITLVQYGYPAQLCFEASGSLTNSRYFGCIIDNVEFCKVGVTTDPNFIKPESPGMGGGGYQAAEPAIR